LGKAFFEAQEKSFLIQEQCPGHKEKVHNYELDKKPVLSFEFLGTYLKRGINKLLEIICDSNNDH
jgi:hypothetical protein